MFSSEKFLILALALSLSACAKPAAQIASEVLPGINLGQEEPDSPPQPEQPNQPSQPDIFAATENVAKAVDQIYSSSRELLVTRSQTQSHPSDSCEKHLEGKSRFADVISYFSYQQMSASKAPLAPIAVAYSLPATTASMEPVSLISHAMCPVTAETLQSTLTNNVPSAAVIAKANQFVNRYNSLREQNNTLELHKLWGRFFMCLSYVESLTTADTNTSQNVADRYAPATYRKPAGVKFYEDSTQPLVSRLNIGLYQFSPDSGGNIFPCIDQWNTLYPTCQVAESGDQAEMIKTLGSSAQHFNAFCGVNKVQQTFSVQVNTSRASATHPSNKVGTNLKSAVNRCVSLHFRAGLAYNHFGPLQNSTGQNLEELLDCALAP